MIEIIKAFRPSFLQKKLQRYTRPVFNRVLKKDPKQSGEVVGQYLKRQGSCNQCGRCCTNIYLIHEEHTLKTIEEFERYRSVEPEFEGFIPVDQDEHGLKFQCKHLKPDNTCAIYDDRPGFCRYYPSEEGILMGGALAEQCGYSFEVITKFKAILAKTAQQQ